MSLARKTFAAATAFIACFLLGACAGDASFQRGVIGVQLPDSTGKEAAWSPDGRWLAIPVKTGIRLRHVQTGKTREIKAPPLQGFPEDPGPLSWSADGRTLRYVTAFGPREENVSWLTEVRRDGSGLRQTALPVKAQTLGWGPGGLPLAFTTGSYALDFEKGLIGPKPALYVIDGIDGQSRRIVQIVNKIGEADIGEPQFSPEGDRIVFLRHQRRKVGIWSVGVDGSSPRPLLTGLWNARQLTRSPNGKQIAFLGGPVGKQGEGLYVLAADGSHPRLVSEEEIVYGPVWSPDGRWITFSNFDGEIRRVHPDGRGVEVVAELPDQEIRALLWSPDGRRLAYTAREFPVSD
jgi:Tol biopolymer transport system component